MCMKNVVEGYRCKGVWVLPETFKDKSMLIDCFRDHSGAKYLDTTPQLECRKK